jgi:uncharacterized protein
MKLRIDASAARSIALRARAGFSPEALGGISGGREGVLEVLRGIGYIQIDTIHVVERAHHHALWSRVPDYDTGDLGALEAEPRRIFEYWAHAAAYLPMEDYRFCLPRMERVRREGHDWFRADAQVVDYVRGRIAAEGPLSAKDFEDPRESSAGWWDWKPAKIALERLFQAGEILVVTRKNFQKIFDLAERVMPPGLDLRTPDEAEMASRYVDAAAAAYGIFAVDEAGYQRDYGKSLIEGEIAARVESGSLAEIEIEGCPVRYFARPDSVAETAGKGPVAGGEARILSPFDPFVIDRKRIARLFGFEYHIECYLPEAKRSFGYFALPILSGDRFVGLVDAKADRAAKSLIVRRLALDDCEPEPVARALLDYARFNGAVTVAFAASPEGKAAKAVKRALKKRKA